MLLRPVNIYVTNWNHMIIQYFTVMVVLRVLVRDHLRLL